ncbi:MAG: hypothetical protein PHE59_01120 [Patescibacteria group bacterium]|nr:hypothetical protein [Patescibacteria group bacterium]MDD5164272.1 hypothetical protein [Patescibacteria group bacterium]MDD5535047.1 hypothetical protein [Patescibacteria group bacterium]
MKNFETPNLSAETKREKALNPNETKELGQDMKEYTEGLKLRIEEIKTELKTETNTGIRVELENELADLEEQYEGLKGFTDDIESGNFEEIIEK